MTQMADNNRMDHKTVDHQAADHQAVDRRGELVLLGLLALLWGSSYLFIKVALETLPPLTLIAGRVTGAAIILAVVLHVRGMAYPKRLRDWARLLLQAFLNSIGAWTLLAWGQQQVDSALAGVLNSTSPIFVFLFTLALGAGGGWMKLAGAVMGLFGVVLIVGPGALDGLGRTLLAQLAVLVSAILYAGAAINARRFADMPSPVVATGTMVLSALVLVPAALIVDAPWRLDPSLLSLAAAAMLSVFCTAGALLIYFRLARTLGAMGVASQAYLRAGVSVLLGVALLGERLTPVIGAGICCAIVGVALINWPRQVSGGSSPV